MVINFTFWKFVIKNKFKNNLFYAIVWNNLESLLQELFSNGWQMKFSLKVPILFLPSTLTAFVSLIVIVIGSHVIFGSGMLLGISPSRNFKSTADQEQPENISDRTIISELPMKRQFLSITSVEQLQDYHRPKWDYR